MKSISGALLVFIALIIHFYIPSLQTPPTQIDASQISPSPIKPNLQPVKTESKFEEKITEESESLPYKTIYKDNPAEEAGTETIIEEGEDGEKTLVTKITYHEGKEYHKEIIETKITPAKDRVISRGTKIIWKTLNAPEGEIKYWKKLRVWATQYDSRCFGCNEWTAIGMKAGKGVIAVDPKIIKLRSKVYIPGYGLAIAGDTGGAVKGNKIDLGFEDTRTSGWRTRFIDIYLLD